MFQFPTYDTQILKCTMYPFCIISSSSFLFVNYPYHTMKCPSCVHGLSVRQSPLALNRKLTETSKIYIIYAVMCFCSRFHIQITKPSIIFSFRQIHRTKFKCVSDKISAQHTNLDTTIMTKSDLKMSLFLKRKIASWLIVAKPRCLIFKMQETIDYSFPNTTE